MKFSTKLSESFPLTFEDSPYIHLVIARHRGYNDEDVSVCASTRRVIANRLITQRPGRCTT